MDKKRIKIYLLIAMALFALILRFNAANRLGNDFDEAVYVPIAKEFSEYIENGEWDKIINYNYNIEHPAFTKLIFAGSLLAAKNLGVYIHQEDVQRYIIRMSVAALSTVHVVVITAVNPVAGFFTAVSSWEIKYSSEAMFDAVCTLFATLAVILFIRSGKKLDKFMVLSAIFMGLAYASKYITATTAITLFPFIVYYGMKEKKVWFYIPISMAAFFAANPMIWNDTITRLANSMFFHAGYATGNFVQSFGYPVYQQFLWLSISVPWHYKVVFLKIDLLLLILGFLGLPVLYKKNKILAAWFVVNAVFLLIYPTKWPQYTLIFIPVLALSAGELIMFWANKGWLVIKKNGIPEYIKNVKILGRN